MVPREPAAVCQAGTSETVSNAEPLRTALPSLFSTLMKYVPSVARVKLAVIELALVKVTELADVIAPVELIASTIGTEIKLLPDMTTLLASFVMTVGLIEEIVGFVSPTVTDPPSETAEPFIVIAEFANDELGTADKRALGTVPDVNEAAVIPGVIVTVSPPSPIVIVDPEFFLIVFTLISDVIIYLAVVGTPAEDIKGFSANAA